MLQPQSHQPLQEAVVPFFILGKRRLREHLTSRLQASLKWLSNGKPEFKHLGQLFVDITEATANVHYIKGVVQKKWGADHIIVTADGLQLDDSPGTQGMPYLETGNGLCMSGSVPLMII